jgi:excinuclease ABC subunit C
VVLERPANIPDAPGSYQFKDADGRIIYVGKARSLRQRLSNYFQDRSALHPRTAQMMDQAASVEWITVRSDVEAIMLEYTLIKVNRPRFNVRLVDDKSYPYLAITLDEEWPRALVMRGAKRKGTRYFGPYSHAWAIRDTLDLLLRSFPIRTCSNAKFARHQRLGRPCLLFHIERCCGPCTEPVERSDYDTYLEELMAFLEGRTAPVIRRLEAEMLAASEDLEYERAALLRDRLGAVRLAAERQEMVADVHDDLDAIGLADGELEAAAQVLHVRSGRVVGRRGFILEKVEPLGRAALLGRVLEQCYAETPLGIPREVLVPELPEDDVTYAAWLGERRAASDRNLRGVLASAAAGDSHIAGETYRRAGSGEDPGAGHGGSSRRARPVGSKVEIRVPQRGRKRALVDVATENAGEQLTRHRLRRASDLTTRAQALEQLQEQLGLSLPPLRIECYDMSHLQGTDYVGSMVVMEDGLPKRSDYRRFKVSAVQGNDDYGAMYEVLTRRLRRLEEGGAPGADGYASGEEDGRRRRPSRFAYPPQLLLLDGGKGQLGVGVRVLDELGLAGKIEIAALAKQFEEVFVPDRDEPVRLPRDSQAIYLLQQIRDEAHRFAIGYHRDLRGKRMTKGALDGIPGLGPARRKRLTEELGGVRGVRAASIGDLRGLDWLPERVAVAVYERLNPGAELHARADGDGGRDEGAVRGDGAGARREPSGAAEGGAVAARRPDPALVAG